MDTQAQTTYTRSDVSARGLNSPWFRRHAVIAPFGIFIVTWLTCWSDTGTWRCWSDWSATSSLVDLAVVIYGMIAVAIEKGLDVVFWALEQRKKRREAFRAQVRAEARTEVAEELRAKAHLKDDRESLDDWVERVARDLEGGRRN